MPTPDPWTPTYEPWRHGGWYVTNVRYPSGASGCVSRNYADKKWRIACDPRPFEERPTFPNRDAAARAEKEMAASPAIAIATARKILKDVLAHLDAPNDHRLFMLRQNAEIYLRVVA